MPFDDAEPQHVEAVRAGFVGGGFMGTVHSRASRAAGARLTAIVGSSPERGQRAAVELGIERGEPDLSRLVEASDVELVHVCSPNARHAEHALAAIAAGKHVICEKPLATSHADARRMTDAAERAGVVGAVPFVYRYHPMVRQARALVAGGALGRVLTVDGAYLQDWMLDADDQNWRAAAEVGGASRAFADIGSHLCDLVEFVANERIVRLSARTRTVFPERAGSPVANEDIAALLVELEDGALGTLLISQLAPGRKNGLTIELHGTIQSVAFRQERPEELWIGARRGSRLVLRDGDADDADSARLSVLPAGHPLGYQDAFNAFVADVYALVRGEERAGVPTFADGARAALVTEAVLASAAADGAWVAL